MLEVVAEHSMVRTRLDGLAEPPWSLATEERIDLTKARVVLDADHHDFEKVKKRVLEYLAVRKLNPQRKTPILCFVGPPGVGKTKQHAFFCQGSAQHCIRTRPDEILLLNHLDKLARMTNLLSKIIGRENNIGGTRLWQSGIPSLTWKPYGGKSAELLKILALNKGRRIASLSFPAANRGGIRWLICSKIRITFTLKP
ncbi:MAG: hypothetical protein ACXWZE_05905 [Candidatus Binatia bacterium]